MACRLAQPVSRPLQPGLRFLRIPLPARPLVRLAASLPMGSEAYGLTLFRTCLMSGVGPSFPPAARWSTAGRTPHPAPGCSPFWDEPVSAFGSAFITTFIRGSLALAIPLFPDPSPRDARSLGFSSRIRLPITVGLFPGASRTGSCRWVVASPCVRAGNSWWNNRSPQVICISL